MAKIEDPEFINWVLEKVCDSNGITAKEINRSDESKQRWADLRKTHVNSALYQLEGKGKIYKEDPADSSLAPVWHCYEKGSGGGSSSPEYTDSGPLGYIP